jgi:uncharacterized protein YbjQ (UPF0145 family)
MIVVTTNDLPGYHILRVVGLVRGITVRSRSVFGTIGGGLQSLLGGNITLFTSLAETSRQEALDLMIRHAEEAGGNAIIAMRYDANEITDGITEMLAYGTAVIAEQIEAEKTATG